MQILVKRIAKLPTYTIGKIFIDGNYICDSIEDTDRNLTQNMPLSEIKKKKVYGETAIPTGTYKVVMDVVSPKFKDRVWAKPYKGKLPRLLDVPGFDGVLIHVLNTAEESLGCIGPGYNKIKGRVVNSTEAFHKIMSILLTAKDEIMITIE